MSGLYDEQVREHDHARDLDNDRRRTETKKLLLNLALIAAVVVLLALLRGCW